jgi:hypothetical protein
MLEFSLTQVRAGLTGHRAYYVLILNKNGLGAEPQAILVILWFFKTTYL